MLHWASVTRCGLCMSTSLSALLLRKLVLLLKFGNFLGEKIHPQGSDEARATCSVCQTQKDETILEANNNELVSNLAALIQQASTVEDKDIRKTLDGIYVSEKEQFSRLMNKIWRVQLQKQQDARWFYDSTMIF